MGTVLSSEVRLVDGVDVELEFVDVDVVVDVVVGSSVDVDVAEVVLRPDLKPA